MKLTKEEFALLDSVFDALSEDFESEEAWLNACHDFVQYEELFKGREANAVVMAYLEAVREPQEETPEERQIRMPNV